MVYDLEDEKYFTIESFSSNVYSLRIISISFVQISVAQKRRASFVSRKSVKPENFIQKIPNPSITVE